MQCSAGETSAKLNAWSSSTCPRKSPAAGHFKRFKKRQEEAVWSKFELVEEEEKREQKNKKIEFHARCGGLSRAETGDYLKMHDEYLSVKALE